MSFKLTELNSTKVLDVQSLKFGSADDAGYDMYIPKVTTNFLKLLLNHPSNTKINTFLCILEDGNEIDKIEDLADVREDLEIKELFLYETILIEENDVDPAIKRSTPVLSYKKGIIKIFDLISIPTGLQFLMSKGYWGEMCNRSSNFGLNLNVVTGYIDNTYTYSTAFQVHPINFTKPIEIEAETRIAQLILRPQIKPLYVHHSYEAFEQDPQTIYNRQKRSGGFGSTGTK